MLRTQLSHVRVLIAVRDPRDMLLDWIAFRAPLMLRVESPLQMAQWLARHLEHVAVLHENSPIIYALIKLDEIHGDPAARSEEHTSELQSLMRNSYAVFCLKTKKKS